MNSPLVWVVLSYMFSIFMFFNQNSMILFWCLLEINMIMLISLFYFIDTEDKMVNSEQCFFYFVIQSIGSFMILMSFKFSSLMLWTGFSNFIFILSVVLKMGLWPFSTWVYLLSYSISRLKVFILLSIQKVPLFYLIFSSVNVFSYIFLLISFLVGSIFLFNSSSITNVMISSSIYSTIWVGYIYSVSSILFFTYLIIYFTFLLIILKDWREASSDKFFSFSAFMFFLGLPPLSLFFFKILMVIWVGTSLGVMDFLIFWGASFLGLFGYSKMFFQYLYMKFYMYLNDESFYEKMSLFFLPSSFFFLFLI